nr:cytochrome c [Gemmatimonadaceae bacterium]
GGVGAQLTPAVFERAVRHGVGPDGRALRIMPAESYQFLTDDDLAAVAAYVRSRPPVDHELPASSLRLLPRALMLAGAMPLLPAEGIAGAAPRAMTITPSPTGAYGEYLANVGGCKGCHGEHLSGGPRGGPPGPPAANLTPGGQLGKWTEQQFVSTLRTGKRPDGTPLSEAMPWRRTGLMTDDEMHAVWQYLRTVPARPYGGR